MNFSVMKVVLSTASIISKKSGSGELPLPNAVMEAVDAFRTAIGWKPTWGSSVNKI
jgi:hypothetical protein